MGERSIYQRVRKTTQSVYFAQLEERPHPSMCDMIWEFT